MFAILYTALTTTLAVCAVKAWRSHKQIGIYVSRLLVSIIPAVVGNLLVIYSSEELLSTIGYYFYFLSIDAIVFSSIHFARTFSHVAWPGKKARLAIQCMLLFDIVQLLLDPIFNHAFDLDPVIVDGKTYFKVTAYWGLTFHRFLCYVIIFMAMGIFLYKVITAPRIYVERYAVILAVMVIAALWQAFYVFSRTPVDRSMIGYSFYGLMTFYFALYYRPRRLLDSMLADISADMNEALFFFDASRRCVWANEPGVVLANIEDEDYERAKDALISIFGEPDLDVGQGNTEPKDWSIKKSVGDKYYSLESHVKRDTHGNITASYLRVRDNTEEQLAFEHEQHAARHDALTGLYNKEYLYQCVAERVKSGDPYSIIFVDIEDFKIINDIFGNDFGDYTLQCVADYLRAVVPDGSIYGRITSDQFGICVRSEDMKTLSASLTEHVVRKDNKEHKLIMHAGIYDVVDPDIDVSVMFDRAHMALQTIKGDYNRHIAKYTDELREQTIWAQEISAELPKAIQEKQIVPYFQPITDAEGRTIGAEVLVRWIHPVHGFLPPIKFIPIFEKNGMIAMVDKYMWRCACEILSQWKDNDKFLSINISPRDFYFMDVAAEICSLVAEYHVEPRRLRLEITETVMMSDIENRIKMIGSLREKGFLMEMDDFGSGYSSLNMLKDMPVDVVKIDMAFLRQAREDNKAMKILRNVIHMTDDLGLLSLTEGVETSLQFEALSSMGCKMFQGYYFAKPLPREAFERYACISA